MVSKPMYNMPKLMFFGGMCSSGICTLAFSGSFIDALVVFPLGCLLVMLQLISVRHELYSNIFECVLLFRPLPQIHRPLSRCGMLPYFAYPTSLSCLMRFPFRPTPSLFALPILPCHLPHAYSCEAPALTRPLIG